MADDEPEPDDDTPEPDDQATETDGGGAEPGSESGGPAGDTPVDVAMHFYRGELDRVTTWRQRLDRTTDWVVVVLAAVLTWSFSSPSNPHYVLLIGMVVAVVFLVIEAQRYQKYDVWRERVRNVEANYLAGQFDGGPASADGWRDALGDDLREPTFDLNFVAALAHRLRNVYLPLLTLLAIAWGARVSLFVGREPWQETASIGDVSGPIVVAGVGVVYVGALALTLLGERVTRREFTD